MVHAALAPAGAAQNTNLPFDITTLLQYGLLGLIFLCLVFRKFIVPEWVLKDAEARAAKEKEDLERRLSETRDQLNKLQNVFQEQMIPTLTRATEVNAKYNEELQRARLRHSSDSDGAQ